MEHLKKFFIGLEDYLEYDDIVKDVVKHLILAAEKAAADTKNTKVDDQVVGAIKLLASRFLD